jgi:hypothetical protein
MLYQVVTSWILQNQNGEKHTLQPKRWKRYFTTKTVKKRTFPDAMLLISRYWWHVVGNLVFATFWDGNVSWLRCFVAVMLQDWDFMSIWIGDIIYSTYCHKKPTWLSALLNALVTVLAYKCSVHSYKLAKKGKYRTRPHNSRVGIERKRVH